MSDVEPGELRFLYDVVEAGAIDLDRSIRRRHASDESVHPPALPDAVVHPRTAKEVAGILRGANERGIPVTPWAGGSSLEGNPIPVAGGISLDMNGFDDIDIRSDDLQVRVGAGVVYDDLNDTLARFGLRFPPGISSGDVATIGGMIANNASGFNAVRYGVTREHVKQLEVVLPDGRTITCGRPVVKTAAGYSLKDLFVGSEGTLGVVTEATLNLAGIPAATRVALVTFRTGVAASTAVADLMTAGIVPGALEFIDELTVRMVNDHTGIDIPEAPTLLIELHGNAAGVEADVALTETICRDNDALEWQAASKERAADLWRARREALPAYRAYDANLEPAVLGDVVVPISVYPRLVDTIETLAEEHDLLVPTVGHAGDGNLHFAPLVDPGDDAARARAEELGIAIAEHAIELGGSVTGEHGVGIGKRKFMTAEHGEAVSLMRAIKRTIDPNGIMNPGKVLPEGSE